jgi:hypothetical protein
MELCFLAIQSLLIDYTNIFNTISNLKTEVKLNTRNTLVATQDSYYKL